MSVIIGTPFIRYLKVGDSFPRRISCNGGNTRYDVAYKSGIFYAYRNLDNALQPPVYISAFDAKQFGRFLYLVFYSKPVIISNDDFLEIRDKWLFDIERLVSRELVSDLSLLYKNTAVWPVHKGVLSFSFVGETEGIPGLEFSKVWGKFSITSGFSDESAMNLLLNVLKRIEHFADYLAKNEISIK